MQIFRMWGEFKDDISNVHTYLPFCLSFVKVEAFASHLPSTLAIDLKFDFLWYR